ncbi:MAG: EamA family transporter [Legionellales bacterium]|nr:EamA family transporter [Legionellales bacterium]
MIYSLIFILITAFSMLFIQHLDATIPAMLTLLVTTTIAILYFNLVNLNNLKSIYSTCWKHKKLWFAMMLSVLVMQAGAMIAPGIIGASLHGFLYFSWLGALGFLSLGWQDWQKNYMKFYCGLCIVGLIIVNICFALNNTFSEKVLFGLLCSLISGTSAFVYFKQSQTIIKTMQLSASKILAVRFYLTIPLAFAFLPFNSLTHYFSYENLFSIVLLAFISMIIPLYFSQKALEKITSEQNAIIMSFCPALTAIFQEIIFHDVTIQSGFVYLLYSIVILWFYIAQKQIEKIGEAA